MNNENTAAYGSANDIVKMTTLQINSQSDNDHNYIQSDDDSRLRIEILLEGQDNAGKPVNLDHGDWVHITNLCFADTGERLNWRGDSDWCFSILSGTGSGDSSDLSYFDPNTGIYHLIFYVFSYPVGTRRIAVSVDLDNKTSFNTTDKPVGAQKSSVTVRAANTLADIITKMTTLKVKSVSGSDNLNIYANGRNQARFEIQLKGVDSDNNGVNLDHDTWQHLADLCFADNGNHLSWQGGSGWCYTGTANAYAREYPSSSASQVSESSGYFDADSGIYTLNLYVYTDTVNTNRIAVSVDLDNGTSFNTTDTPKGAQTSFVTVSARDAINYHVKDIHVEMSTSGKTQHSVTYHTRSEGGGGDYTESMSYNAWRDDYHVTLSNNLNINNYEFNLVPGNYILNYDSHHNGQQMLMPNPSGNSNVTAGFHNTHNDSFLRGSQLYWGFDYDLTQSVPLNSEPGTICVSHLAFDTNSAWIFPDNMGLDKTPYWYGTENQSVTFYDDYGNYGKIYFDFTDDNSYVRFVDSL